MRDIFKIEEKPFNRHKCLVKSNNVNSVNYGTNATYFAGP